MPPALPAAGGTEPRQGAHLFRGADPGRGAGARGGQPGGAGGRDARRSAGVGRGVERETAARAGRGQAGRRSGIQADLRTGLELEAQGIALLFGTEDQVEGMSAFLEKREAKCTGE